MSPTPVEKLTAAQCWELLATAAVGRLAVATEEGVDIFPVNYLVKDQAVYFASAPGSKLVKLTRRPVVAFESDGVADRRRWSVVVKGRAVRLDSDVDIRQSGVLELASLNPTDKWNYIRITANQITGRRFVGVHHLS